METKEQGETFTLRLLFRFHKRQIFMWHLPKHWTPNLRSGGCSDLHMLARQPNYSASLRIYPPEASVPKKNNYRFLKDSGVRKVMQASVVGAYPDPTHYMRIHIKRVVPHSNGVTAAICLKQGGAHNDEIARWHVSSVPTYLR